MLCYINMYSINKNNFYCLNAKRDLNCIDKERIQRVKS